jgi:GT2 family glycosyltransferase
MKLTVVICTHNRCDLLNTAIDSINSANRPEGYDISILVIANACADASVSYLKQYQAQQLAQHHLPLTFFEEPRPGKSYALNQAIRLTASGYLCFMDDDQRLDKNYFAKIIDALSLFPQASLLCGPLLPDWQGDEPAWIHETGKYRIYPLPIPVFDLGQSPLRISQVNQTPPGGQVIIHHDVFQRVGQFSEKLGPTGHNLMGSEDTEFFMRAIAGGEVFYYLPSIIQYHYIDKKRLRLSYLLNVCFQRNRSITLARHPACSAVPLYLFRQLAGYAFGILFSLSLYKTRFYLMRFFSTLGEIMGLISTLKINI